MNVSVLTIMEASSFYFFVLPLRVFVFLMASLVFYYARRDERAERRIVKLVNAYVKTASKHKESYDKQLNKLQELLKNQSIDEVTYERVKQALENDYAQKRGEAKMQLSSEKGKNTPFADADT